VSRPPKVVTISAAYGAGGSFVGPELARRLGLPFLDRAIPATVAQRLGTTLEAALAHDERTESAIRRLLAAFAKAPELPPFPSAPAGGYPDEHAFRAQTEKVISELAETSGAVILGRAAALVLGRRPGTLHVRLDGPEERRIRQAMALAGIDEPQARELLRDTDRARDAYAHHFYRRRLDDPLVYHMLLDSTTLPLEACVALISSALESLDSTAPSWSAPLRIADSPAN
jgi:cytidylate kinase